MKNKTDTTLLRKINWSLTRARGGFKKMKNTPDPKSAVWLEQLQLKILEGGKMTSKETEKLDMLYVDMSPVDCHEDNLKVTTWTTK